MEYDEGGGASPTTAPASGSSAPTDVSLREYTARDLWWLDRYTRAEIAALRRETFAATSNAATAVSVAAGEAKERLHDHNGLIELVRQQAQECASREALETFKVERQHILDAFKDETDKRFGRVERFQSMMIGGMLIVSAIGIANFVRIWTG